MRFACYKTITPYTFSKYYAIININPLLIPPFLYYKGGGLFSFNKSIIKKNLSSYSFIISNILLFVLTFHIINLTPYTNFIQKSIYRAIYIV